VQQGVLGLGGLEARVELGLVGDEGGGEVRGEDAVGGEEVWSAKCVSLKSTGRNVR
jgi:hypothetical protein